MITSPMKMGRPHRIAHAQHLGVLDQPVDFRQADADEDGRGNERKDVRPADRPQRDQLDARRQQTRRDRNQHVSRPIAETERFDHAIGRIGAGEDERAVSKIHDARGFINNDNAERGERIDGPDLEATNNNHDELGKHGRRLR